MSSAKKVCNEEADTPWMNLFWCGGKGGRGRALWTNNFGRG